MSNFEDHLYVVILCGGTGTRVWPLSMNKKPKQFLNFYENRTLFQGALFRALQIVPAKRVILVTNENYLDELKKEAPQVPLENIISETEKKNTAMAMGIAAAWAAKIDPEATLINLPSDHVVKNIDLFAKTMKAAGQVAYEKHKIITVGIKPTYAHPGFGYIQVDQQVFTQSEFPLSKVHSFKEKPDIETAQKYLDDGHYLWNAGFYIWRADILASEFDRLSPDISIHIKNLAKALGTPQEKEVLAKEYRQVPEAPIDTAIAEKTDKLLVIPGTFDWNDVGSWQVVYELGQKDENQNVFVQNLEAKTKPPVEIYQTNGSLIYSTNMPIAVVGLTNVVIVDTGSGILVCDREKSNDVKKIVEQLKSKKLNNYL